MRENFTGPGLNAWLDTPGGVMFTALHGSRQHAAAAMAEADQLNRAWRRQQAVARAERFPGRYPSVDDAMMDVPDPQGGGAWLGGPSVSTDDLVAQVRWVNPAAGVRNLGGEPEAGDVQGAVQAPGRGLQPADTRPPWQREG